MDKNTIVKEKAKYERLYNEVPEYTNFSPAMLIVNEAMGFCRRNDLKSVLDIGCATGRATKAFHDKGFNVFGLDITLKGVDKAIKDEIGDCFVEAPVEDIPFKGNSFDYVFCIDFMEHVHPDNVYMALAEMSRVCKGYARFQIALNKDGFGKRIGAPLHISLFSVDDWSKRIMQNFIILSKVQAGSVITFLCQPKCKECRLGR